MHRGNGRGEVQLREAWKTTLSVVREHAITIVACCMMLALVAVGDNAWARWLNYKERQEWRAELNSLNTVMANAVTVLKDLENQRGNIDAHREEMRALRIYLEQKVK